MLSSFMNTLFPFDKLNSRLAMTQRLFIQHNYPLIKSDLAPNLFPRQFSQPPTQLIESSIQLSILLISRLHQTQLPQHRL